MRTDGINLECIEGFRKRIASDFGFLQSLSQVESSFSACLVYLDFQVTTGRSNFSQSTKHRGYHFQTTLTYIHSGLIFIINLTQLRVIRKEGMSVKELPGSS